MLRRLALLWLVTVAAGPAVAKPSVATAETDFPPELVRWIPLANNPVFAAAGPGHWDAAIRERGWILREGDAYHLWYTGYDDSGSNDSRGGDSGKNVRRKGLKQLGYATSPDGIHWTRSANNPLCQGHYVEDMMVVRDGETYFMFAEGPEQNVSQMLTSRDRVHWEFAGVLEIDDADGKRRVERPYGTPTVWVEEGVWYLFYERGDLGVWLATSRDPNTLRWTNVQDKPVLSLGPSAYDSEQIALDQIVKYRGCYYALYHASGKHDAAGARLWNTNIARSKDLVHWQKYSLNPLVEDNKSSGILVPTGAGYRLYTMHGEVDAFASPRK